MRLVGLAIGLGEKVANQGHVIYQNVDLDMLIPNLAKFFHFGSTLTMLERPECFFCQSLGLEFTRSILIAGRNGLDF